MISVDSRSGARSGRFAAFPANARKLKRINGREAPERTLADALKEEKKLLLTSGIYGKIQIDLTYCSSRIEGSSLTREQTHEMFEKNEIAADGTLKVDDVVETANHFLFVDLTIDNLSFAPSESFIKRLHVSSVFVRRSKTARRIRGSIGLPSAITRSFQTKSEERRLFRRSASRRKCANCWRNITRSQRDRLTICLISTVVSNVFIRSKTATDGSDGSFCSKNACGTISSRSLSTKNSNRAAIADRRNGRV